MIRATRLINKFELLIERNILSLKHTSLFSADGNALAGLLSP